MFGDRGQAAWIAPAWWARYLVVAVLLAAIIVWRRADVVARPQLWAEDGSIFFCNALVLGFPRALVRLYRGFPYLVPRLIAEIGTLVPVAAAPRVYTTAAIAIESLAVATFCAPRFRHLVRSDRLRIAWCVACVCLPSGAEVFATPTNVGWFLALWLLVVSSSTAPRGRGSFSFVVVGGIATVASTPLAVLLAPLWLLRCADGIVRRDRREVLLGAVLLASVAAIVLTTPLLGAEEPIVLSPTMHDRLQHLDDRDAAGPFAASFSWSNLEIATALTTWSLLRPLDAVRELAVSHPPMFHAVPIALWLLLVGVAAGGGRFTMALCCLSLVIAAHAILLEARPLVNVLVEVPRLWRLLPARYAVFPTGCLLLGVCIALDGIEVRPARIAGILGVVAIVACAWAPAFRIDPLPNLHWPAWAAKLQRKVDAGSHEPLVIPINPLWRIGLDAAPPGAAAGSRSDDRCAASTNHDRDGSWF